MAGLRYDLFFDFPDLETGYRGRVRLSGSFSSPELVLDSEGLRIRSVEVDGRLVPFQADGGTVRIRDVRAGAERVEIGFDGEIEREASVGLYRSPLGAGTALTTHLEPAAARRVFPCLDRPDVKAVFAVEVVAPADLAVVSNAPVQTRDRTPDGRAWSRFEPTPPMSTYLFYLGIGPFEQTERTLDGVRTIVAAAPGLAGKTEFAASQTARALRFFGDYYGLPYPLPKMHLVGIPKFLSGAMENWGAIVFAEPFLTVDDRTSAHARVVVSSIVTHEVAHQWFGNLVTMRSWDDLWLNESFATFAGHRALAELLPEWDTWESFYSSQTGAGLVVDSLPGTHPIHVTVTDPVRAAEFFDEVSYAKGASILRMLEQYLGEGAFREAISAYLREHAWGNAQAADLWSALARISRQPVDRVMPDWVLRAGYPVITAEAEDGRLALSQRRFSLRGTTEERPWPLPLRVDVNGSRVDRLMESARLELSVPAAADIRVNPGRSGFYRVRYRGSLHASVLRRYGSLPPVDRMGLQDDGFAFLLAGEIDLPEYLDVLRRLETETHPSVIVQGFTHLTWARPLVRRIPGWETAFRRIFTAQGSRLGLVSAPDETFTTTALRDQVTRARVALDPLFAQELRRHYAETEAMAPEVAEAVLMAYAASADGAEYSELRRRLREARSGPESRIVAGGLGMLGRDDWLLECLRLLGTPGMSQAVWTRLLFTAVWLNPLSGPALWEFLTSHLESHIAPLATGGGVVAAVLQYTIPVVGLSQPAELRRWLSERAIPEGEEGTKKGLDMLSVFENVLTAARRQGIPIRDSAGT